ncbi:MAG: HutP family protein, partial [Bacillota bacterium]
MAYGSKKIASAAIRMALTETREEENALKKELESLGIKAAAVDCGGEYITSVKKIVERAIVAAK